MNCSVYDITVCCDYGAGLVVPDVPLEETDILRIEAAKHGIELASPLFVYCLLFIILLYVPVLLYVCTGTDN